MSGSSEPATDERTSRRPADAGGHAGRQGPILVAVTGDASSDAAPALAFPLAGRTGADVRVVSVVEQMILPDPGASTGAGPSAVSDERIAERRRLVEAQLERVGVPAGAWAVDVVVGDPAERIAMVARALDARLVTLARNPRPRSGWWHRVRLALQLLRQADVPVLVVAPELARLPRRVVVATDFSPFSAHAAEVGLGFAAEDALVHLVHVGDASGAWILPRVPGAQRGAPAMLRQLRHELEAGGDRQVESVTLVGDAVSALADFLRAAGSDLVVVGSHGRGFIERLVLGSVSAGLLHRSPCSVLCVPGASATLAAHREQAHAGMTTSAVPEAGWDAALAELSRDCAGRRCTVEVDHLELGAQSLVEGVPFAGASYDRRERSVTLRLGSDVAKGAHLAHVVRAVSGVDVLRDERDTVRALRLVEDGGHTLVTFVT